MLETLVMGSALDVELLPQSTMKPSPIMHTARKLHVLPFAFNPATMEYDQNTTTAAGGGGAVTIADGADVAEGATTNAAVITDVAGTVSGKLRGLVKWAFERMPSSLGQATMAASLPVVISSNQSAVPVSGTVTATGPLTDAQLRATPVPVSGTVTANAGTNLNTSLLMLDATFTARINTLGQKAMVASTPVVLASDQASIPVAATIAAAIPAGTNNIGDVDVLTLPSIPAGANTIGGVNLTQYTPSGGRLPIELDAAALAALETITVAAITAALPAGNNNIGDVDLIPGQVGITGGAGVTAANTPRVVQALDPLTASAPIAAAVGVASAAALAANASRKAAVLVNTSDNVISLAFGAPAVLNSGITLFPGGTFNLTRDNFFSAAEIRAIASVAASNLAIQEFT